MKKPSVPCATCGTLMWTGRGCLPPGQAICLTCRRQRNPKPEPAPDHWYCQTCGIRVDRTSGPVGKYCKTHKWPWNERRRTNAHERRARKRTTQTEPIVAIAVYERDQWRCGICNRRVDPDLNHPHPRSASLDHVEPLSLGGTHTQANVQLAHLDCNVRKGNREPAQLRLIG